MNITPTHIAYYVICHRKLWLFSHGIKMEETSDTVYEGKLISETSYPQRAQKYTELDLGVAKIDYYDPEEKLVHEIKKSPKLEKAHEWQVKYYLYLLEDYGIDQPQGLLEYPKQKRTKDVQLSQEDRHYLDQAIEEARTIIHQDQCPNAINKPICKSCSYYEFCYSQ
jgi:CRISPR-associated exonuclease Cas4